jgi:large subunit ribosomal protein L15
MKLNELTDNDGARKSRTRVGRGIGSGKGKTSGRGHKGQKSRSGVALLGMEGGQTPFYMRLPKRGFNKPNQQLVETINLSVLEDFVTRKVLTTKIDREALIAAGLVKKTGSVVKILGKGELKAKIEIAADAASKSAIAAIEKAGGKITLPATEKADKAAK